MCPLILFSVASANFLVTDFRLPKLEIPKGLLKACHHVDCFPVIKHWKELKAKVSSHSVYRYGCYIRPCHVNRDSLCNLWCGFFLPMRGIHCHSLTECLPSLESSLAPRPALGVSLTLQADSCALSTAGWVICAQCRVAWELCFGFCMGLKGARKLKAAQCSADLPFETVKDWKPSNCTAWPLEQSPNFHFGGFGLQRKHSEPWLLRRRSEHTGSWTPSCWDKGCLPLWKNNQVSCAMSSQKSNFPKLLLHYLYFPSFGFLVCMNGNLFTDFLKMYLNSSLDP